MPNNAPVESAPELRELLESTPDAVVARLRVIADDLRLAYSANTLRIWRANWRVWCAFSRQHGVATLPTDVPTIKVFLLERLLAKRKRATLEGYLATLAMIHRLAQIPNPMDSMEGKLMWRGLRRTMTARQRQAQGLTLADIASILAVLDPKVAIDRRDAALVSVAFESMLRRSELVSLKISDLGTEADGSGRIFIERSKTDQEGVGSILYLSPPTVQRVRDWLGHEGLTNGAMFRSVPKGRRTDVPRPLSERDVARIFKRLALRAGLDPERISAHSTRVGATQDLLAANISGSEIMRQGRWKSERMLLRYGEKLEAGRSAMAQLTDSSTKK